MILDYQKTILKTNKMKTITYKIGNGTKSIAASLIILASFFSVAKAENKTISSGNETTEISLNNHELANQMESWINNSAYWENDAEDENQELALEMKSWMNNGSYFSGEEDTDNNEQGLALQMKTWMNNGSYFSDEEDTHNNEQELTLQIKSWMNNGAYFSGKEEQINVNNELANK